jgi:transketolase
MVFWPNGTECRKKKGNILKHKEFTMYTLKEGNKLSEMSKKLRRHVIEMLYHAKSGHPGGALSSADIFSAFYFGEVLRYFPQDPYSLKRDYFVLSVGHYCPVLYAALALAGFFPIEQLNSFRRHGSSLLGHPRRHALPGIENTSGSLGQGISIAAGIAKGLKMQSKNNKVFCLMSDGEQDEGQIWEAVLFASHHKLDNLCAIIDVNKIQIDGFTRDVMNTEPLDSKYESFGWRAVRIDGHDFTRIYEALNTFSGTKDQPTVIVADTIAGKGLSSLEGTVESHGEMISDYHYQLALKELS